MAPATGRNHVWARRLFTWKLVVKGLDWVVGSHVLPHLRLLKH